jgi:hypothetical protein
MQNAYSTAIESDRVLAHEDSRIRAELNERTKSTELFFPPVFTLFVVIDGCQTTGLVLLSEKKYIHGHKQMYSAYFVAINITGCYDTAVKSSISRQQCKMLNVLWHRQ